MAETLPLKTSSPDKLYQSLDARNKSIQGPVKGTLKTNPKQIFCCRIHPVNYAGNIQQENAGSQITQQLRVSCFYVARSRVCRGIRAVCRILAGSWFIAGRIA
jgi:hypothetical protein